MPVRAPEAHGHLRSTTDLTLIRLSSYSPNHRKLHRITTKTGDRPRDPQPPKPPQKHLARSQLRARDILFMYLHMQGRSSAEIGKKLPLMR